MKIIIYLFFAMILLGCVNQPSSNLDNTNHKLGSVKEYWVFSLDLARWEKYFSNHDEERVVNEYKLIDEKIESWTQLIGTELYLGAQDLAIMQQLIGIKKKLLTGNCERVNWNQQTIADNAVIIEWSNDQCKNFKPQSEIMRYQLSNLGIHVIRFTENTKKLDAQTQNSMLKMIMEAKLQLD